MENVLSGTTNNLGENEGDAQSEGIRAHSTTDDTIDAVGGVLSQRAKLIQRICSRPPNARFRDVQRLLEAFGWTMARQRGSHVTFTQSGELPITVPIRDGKVGRIYLVDNCSRLGIDDES